MKWQATSASLLSLVTDRAWLVHQLVSLNIRKETLQVSFNIVDLKCEKWTVAYTVTDDKFEENEVEKKSGEEKTIVSADPPTSRMTGKMTGMEWD